MCFIVAIGIFFPRFAMLALWLFSNWFGGVFDKWFWPVLGFVFMPYTTLWYSAVVNWYDNTWGPFQIILLIIAIICDLSSSGAATKGRK